MMKKTANVLIAAAYASALHIKQSMADEPKPQLKAGRAEILKKATADDCIAADFNYANVTGLTYRIGDQTRPVLLHQLPIDGSSGVLTNIPLPTDDTGCTDMTFTVTPVNAAYSSVFGYNDFNKQITVDTVDTTLAATGIVLNVTAGYKDAGGVTQSFASATAFTVTIDLTDPCIDPDSVTVTPDPQTKLNYYIGTGSQTMTWPVWTMTTAMNDVTTCPNWVYNTDAAFTGANAAIFNNNCTIDAANRSTTCSNATTTDIGTASINTWVTYTGGNAAKYGQFLLANRVAQTFEMIYDPCTPTAMTGIAATATTTSITHGGTAAPYTTVNVPAFTVTDAACDTIDYAATIDTNADATINAAIIAAIDVSKIGGGTHTGDILVSNDNPILNGVTACVNIHAISQAPASFTLTDAAYTSTQCFLFDNGCELPDSITSPSNTVAVDYVLGSGSILLTDNGLATPTLTWSEFTDPLWPGTTVATAEAFTLTGLDYAGWQTVSKAGHTCQAWSDQTPVAHDITVANGCALVDITAAGNKCRNWGCGSTQSWPYCVTSAGQNDECEALTAPPVCTWTYTVTETGTTAITTAAAATSDLTGKTIYLDTSDYSLVSGTAYTFTVTALTASGTAINGTPTMTVKVKIVDNPACNPPDTVTLPTQITDQTYYVDQGSNLDIVFDDWGYTTVPAGQTCTMTYTMTNSCSSTLTGSTLTTTEADRKWSVTSVVGSAGTCTLTATAVSQDGTAIPNLTYTVNLTVKSMCDPPDIVRAPTLRDGTVYLDGSEYHEFTWPEFATEHPFDCPLTYTVSGCEYIDAATTYDLINRTIRIQSSDRSLAGQCVMTITALTENSFTPISTTSFTLTMIAEYYYSERAKQQRLMNRHYVYPAIVRIARNVVNLRPISSITDFTGFGPPTGFTQGGGFTRGGQDTFEVAPEIDFNSRGDFQPVVDSNVDSRPVVDTVDSRVDQFGDPFADAEGRREQPRGERREETSDPFREADRRERERLRREAERRQEQEEERFRPRTGANSFDFALDNLSGYYGNLELN